MTPTSLATLFIKGDYYEVFYRDSIIVRVIKYPSDTQIPRDILFNDLQEPVKVAILNKLSEKD